MPRRHVALLRGINVGRAKRIAMADLRIVVAGLGYLDVRTLLNSGNVVFSVPDRSRGDPAARIQHAISAHLGVSSKVTVLTGAELETIVAGNPLAKSATDPSRLLLTVLTNPSDGARLTPLTQQDWSPEVLALGARVAYQWCPDGMLESRLVQAVGRIVGDGATTRNWATMTKLHALVGERD
jgi:uncharacterized protein (DUF1697 family)